MSILGVILAGGKSSRFGSDKAEALYLGQPLIAQVAAAISGQVDAMAVAGRAYGDWPAITDRPAPNMGPLTGLAGALNFAANAGHEYVLSVGVDNIGLPENLAAILSPAPGYIKSQPIIGLWPVSVLEALDKLLASQERHSMLNYISKIGARAVELDTPPANINSAADLSEWEKKQ